MIRQLRFSFAGAVLGLTGCASPSPSIGPAQSIALTSSPAARAIGIVRRPNRGPSWMDATTGAKSLLYVANQTSATVTIYDYNDGKNPKLKGMLTGFTEPVAPCTDAAGTLYVPDYGNEIISVYPRGAKMPKRFLSDPGRPNGCAVDPKTGNLAVINYSTYSGSGDVAIFPQAKGTPVSYSDPGLSRPQTGAYDSNGNLFVDGEAKATGLGFALAELPIGQTSFTNFEIKGGSPYFPGQVQWSGSYLLVGDQAYHGGAPSAVYEMTVSKSIATVKKTVLLKGTQDVISGWMTGSGPKARYVAPDFVENAGLIFAFPKGKQSSMFSGTDNPVGATVSQKD
jgi:hypothetical protein